MGITLPDLDKLLSPFDGENPTGSPLPDDDFSSPLVELRGFCRTAIRSEKSDSEETREEAAKVWVQAAEKGLEILEQHWKSLDIVAMLIQALARTNGVAGAGYGYQLVDGLVDRYWEQLAAPWDGNYEQGLKALSDLNAALPASLRREEIADSPSGPVFYYQFALAQRLADASPEERDHHVARGALQMADLERRVAETPDEYYVQLLGDLTHARQAIESSSSTLAEKLNDAEQIYALPATSDISELLEDIERIVRALIGERLVAAEQQEEAAAGEDQAAGQRGTSEAGSATAGKPRDRSEALGQLEQLATYLESVERQSMVPVVVRYAVWLGRLEPREFFQYFNQHGEQLYQILEPILGSSGGEDEEYSG